MFTWRRKRRQKKVANKNKKHIYQYHGHANSMPKRLREYFNEKGVVFEKDDFVDVVEYVEIELVNIWKKGK